MYLPVVTAHLRNLPPKDSSNSVGCNKFISFTRAGMNLVYQRDYLEASSADSLDLSLDALFLWITFFFAARSKSEKAFATVTLLGFLRAATKASLKVDLDLTFTFCFFLSARSLRIAPVVIGIARI